MISRINWYRIILIAGLSVTISILHYITAIGEIYKHIFYRELYFLPLLLAGFWFGLRGGMITSVSITILYFPTLILHWQGFSPDDFDKILEIFLFNIAAAGLGYLSDRLRIEEKEKISAEQRSREQAESANRLKSDFLSLISHELRTPLISIIGYNDLLLDGVAGSLNEEQIDALKKIDKNSKKLSELITAMLDISRIEAQPVELMDIAISELIAEIKSENKNLIDDSGLNFTWQIEPNLHLRSDPVKIKLIVRNLISNAVKFTEKGEVVVEAQRQDDGIAISVTDTGIGIAPEGQQLIFDPFRQIEGHLTREHGGLGLGLYTAKRLLEFLNGKIEVKSAIGHGSTFSIWLPMESKTNILKK